MLIFSLIVSQQYYYSPQHIFFFPKLRTYLTPQPDTNITGDKQYMYVVLKNKQTHSVNFSMQANYTDCATATGRRILVPTFADRGVRVVNAAVHLGVLDRSRYFSFKQLLIYPHKG
jgi:hypothetical protein